MLSLLLPKSQVPHYWALGPSGFGLKDIKGYLVRNGKEHGTYLMDLGFGSKELSEHTCSGYKPHGNPSYFEY